MTGSQEADGIADAVRRILDTISASPAASGISDSASLLESGVLDSLAMVDLVAALESRFGVVVPEAELVPEHFDSLAAIVALVRTKLEGR